jgi:hypothetical protein
MDILVAVIVLGGVIGLIVKWARDNARRDQEALESLRDLVEGKEEEIRRRNAS